MLIFHRFANAVFGVVSPDVQYDSEGTYTRPHCTPSTVHLSPAYAEGSPTVLYTYRTFLNYHWSYSTTRARRVTFYDAARRAYLADFY